MQELVGEFEEKVCEIIADTIFNSIKRHQMYYSQNKQNPVIQVKKYQTTINPKIFIFKSRIFPFYRILMHRAVLQLTMLH